MIQIISYLNFPIKIGNNHVKRVQITNYSAIHLNNNEWNKHVDRLCSKVNRSTSGLRQARDYVLLDVFFKMLFGTI